MTTGPSKLVRPPRREVRPPGPHLLWAQAAALAACILLALALYGPHPLRWLYVLSFDQSDEPIMPAGQASAPILGPHYFGDWQVFIGWARQSHPYWGEGGHLTVLPPILWILRAIEGVPIAASYVALLVVSLSATACSVRLLAKGVSTRIQLAAWVVFFLGSLGFIVCTDRGNLQTVTVGVLGIWIWAVRERRAWAAAVLLALAICLKPYLAPLLLWPVVHGDWRHVARTVALVAVPSLIGFAIEPGGLAVNGAGYLDLNQAYADHGGITDDLMLATVSALGVLIHPVTLTGGLWEGWEFLLGLPSWALLAPGLLWAALVTYVVGMRLLSSSLRWCFMLSTSQMLLPAGQTYSMGWASLAAVLLLAAPGIREERLVRRLVEAAVVATIVPVPVVFGGYMALPINIALSSMAWAVAGVAAVVATTKSARATKEPVAGSLDPMTSLEIAGKSWAFGDARRLTRPAG